MVVRPMPTQHHRKSLWVHPRASRNWFNQWTYSVSIPFGLRLLALWPFWFNHLDSLLQPPDSFSSWNYQCSHRLHHKPLLFSPDPSCSPSGSLTYDLNQKCWRSSPNHRPATQISLLRITSKCLHLAQSHLSCPDWNYLKAGTFHWHYNFSFLPCAMQ